MNALSEMGVEYIDIEKEDTSQLSAQEAVVKSAKLGKKGLSPVLPTLGDPEPFPLLSCFVLQTSEMICFH